MSTVEIGTEEAQQILKGITIPSPPQIMADLQMEMAMPDPDLGAMADLISKDVGLAGSVLKAVNSPFFGLRKEVDSIRHAVNLLGIRSVVNVVNSYFLRTETIHDDMSEEMVAAMNRFWDTAGDVANASMVIARHLSHGKPDQAYILGLFHNVGVPLLMQRFGNYPETQIHAYASASGQINEVENQELDTSHQVIGYYVARAWKLPRAVCEAISIHHACDRLAGDQDAGDDGVKALLYILKMAEHVVGLYRVLGGQEVDNEWNRIAPGVLEHFGISDYDFEDIGSMIRDMGIGEQTYFM